jgi:endo-1,4-beta-xylanase
MLGAAGAPPNAPGLNERAMRNGRFYGAAIDDHILADDPAYMKQVVHECGILVSEAAFKWGALRPKAEEYDFGAADRLAGFAERHAMMLRGHTLLWHKDNPAWLTESLTPGNAAKLLRDHIRTVAGHFRNRVVHWDVVNEVLQPADGKPLGLRDSLWTRALGAECIDIAFHACAEADPAPLRCINEYGLDYTWPEEEAKRQTMLALLARLKSRGVPVQALGLQAHLQAGVKELDQTKLAQFCADVAAMGLKIVITEFDVRDNRVGGDPALRDAAVASQGRAYLDAVLTCPAVLGVLSWGLSDRRSWLNDELPRDDKLAQRPLPLDADLRRKPLWQAMADAFAAAPPRA